MRFSTFIRNNLEEIVTEWETFARTIPAAHSMSALALRDHCREILCVIADDMDTHQTAQEQSDKSKDLLPSEGVDESAAESHGTLRHTAGFDLPQLFAEFRALRASVLSLWSRSDASSAPGRGIEEVTRFNEGLDQALAESVERFSANLAASRDMFLGVLGHDLRSPLTAIAASNRVLSENALDPGARERASARVTRSVKAMSRLISDLLDYTRSRLGAGIPIERARCDVSLICRDAIDGMQASYPAYRFTLDTSGDLHADIDAAKLEQALGNLLANAAQHGDSSGPVALSAAGEVDAIVLKVANSGPPIPAESLRSVFEPLTQAGAGAQEPNERSQTSMGLGLFIVREIVNGHLGAITVDSSLQKGTVFSIRLPRAATVVPPTAPRSPPS
ncbi:MAG TPA: HAMP domain-containing sensor histidine kinase [Caldimonas sp.]|nr:HAMP domain-containing sensor histidine kinase [Caldimonas sp.]